MRIVFIKNVHQYQCDTVYQINLGVSPYTPYTKHYDLSDPYWDNLMEDPSLRNELIQCRLKGKIPPNAKLPNPTIKRKL